MSNSKNLFRSVIAALLLAGMIGFTGCSGVSEEEMQQLTELRDEVGQLTKEVNTLKSQKTELEREIAVKRSKLEQCKKEKAATQANLKKMGK